MDENKDKLVLVDMEEDIFFEHMAMDDYRNAMEK